MGLDYYAILNLPRDCTLGDIQLAYRKWALCTHPDRQPYPTGLHIKGVPESCIHLPGMPKENIWAYVNEAYDVLVNPLTREVFDRYGEEGLKSGTPTPNGYVQSYQYHRDFMKTYTDVFGTSSPYADLIDAVTKPPPLYTSDEGHKGCLVKGDDIEHQLFLHLKEIFFGTIRQIKIVRQEFIDNSRSKTEIREAILTIRIPPGILTGTRIVCKEEGDRGPTIIPSDICFTIFDEEHSIFSRDEANLYMMFTINLCQALCGFDISINTIDNRTLHVPITDVVRISFSPNYVKTIENEGLPFEHDPSNKGELRIKFKSKTYI